MVTVKDYSGNDVQFDPDHLVMENVKCVYSGKANRCCCGCSGIYRYPSAGNPEPHRSINDRHVKKVLGIVKANVQRGTISNSSPRGHIEVTVGPRLYIVHFTDTYSQAQLCNTTTV